MRIAFKRTSVASALAVVGMLAGGCDGQPTGLAEAAQPTSAEQQAAFEVAERYRFTKEAILDKLKRAEFGSAEARLLLARLRGVDDEFSRIHSDNSPLTAAFDTNVGYLQGSCGTLHPSNRPGSRGFSCTTALLQIPDTARAHLGQTGWAAGGLTGYYTFSSGTWYGRSLFWGYNVNGCAPGEYISGVMTHSAFWLFFSYNPVSSPLSLHCTPDDSGGADDGSGLECQPDDGPGLVMDCTEDGSGGYDLGALCEQFQLDEGVWHVLVDGVFVGSINCAG